MEILEALENRRSINFFDPEKKITEETIYQLINIANLTPSSFNLQPWEVIVVNTTERKKVLRECAFNQQKVEEASHVLIICANPEAVEKNLNDVLDKMVELGYTTEENAEKKRKSPDSFYGTKESENRQFFAIKNASFFAMSLMIAARGLGLETHPMDGFKPDMVKKEFNIPEHIHIPLLLAVGYPKKDLQLLPRAYRRPLEKFVHFNKY